MAKSTSLLGRIPWEEAYAAFLALEPKRQWLAGATVAGVLLLLTFLPISCASSRLGKMESEYLNSQKNLAKLAEKVQEYTNLQAEKAALDADLKKNKGASLATVLEGLASDVGISKNINSLKPRKIASSDEYDEQGLDVQLKGVNLQNSVDYLEKIENSNKLRMKVSKLQIKPKSSKRAELDVTFQVSTLVPKETP